MFFGNDKVGVVLFVWSILAFLWCFLGFVVVGVRFICLFLLFDMLTWSCYISNSFPITFEHSGQSQQNWSEVKVNSVHKYVFRE